MSSIGNYMFRTTIGAFLIILISLTLVLWFTQAMRDFDLITSQRQTLLVFVGITGLIVPLLIMMIAPIALVMAAAHVLNKLSSDSEIIVMNAAGVSPWRLLSPFLAAALVVSILISAIAAYISPRSLRELRDWAAQVRADILTNIVQPGRFTTVSGNLTFHIADRRPNGLLVGIFVDDRRNPKERDTYIAEQGEIVRNDNGSFLVLDGGSIQQLEAGQPDPRMVTFDRYAFDLSKFTGGTQNVTYTVRERYLWELLWPKANDTLYVAQPDQFRSELHDRLAAPLYPIAFIILAFAFLGPPQTNRQSRSLALLGTIGVVSLLRLVGFVSIVVGVRVPAVIFVQYIAIGLTIAFGLIQIGRGRAAEPAAIVMKLATAISESVTRRLGGCIMIAGTLSRYFALRFLYTVLGSFLGVVALAAMIDYVELMRRGADWPNATAWLLAKISLFRVPQLTERIMPFSVLIGAMSCYLALSRRLELVVARAAGLSAWQFIAPAVLVALLFGAVATAAYNPLSAILHERSKRLEAEMFGELPSALQESGSGFWVRQKSVDGQAIIYAKSSRDQGAVLGAVTVFTFDTAGHFKERIEAKSASLGPGVWWLEDARVYSSGSPPVIADSYPVNTNLTREQVRESFATPETVPFWQLPAYIDLADQAGLGAAGYRLQYQKLLSRPFLLAAMVLLAASVSLRFFRFGGVQKMVLSGITAGFLLFVLSKITEDMSKSELLSPVAAAWIPVVVGGLTGFVALLFQEDG